MFMNEVCKTCSLTKKAVEYYMEQGLISPKVKENGYRDFSEEDVETLKKISVLRNLGLSVADIQSVLSGKEEEELNALSHRNALKIAALQEKERLLKELAVTHDWERIQKAVRQLQKKQSVLERILNVFPGYYGNFLCLHFSGYLNEPIETRQQQEAFDTIIDYWDHTEFEISGELQEYFQYLDKNMTEQGEDFCRRCSADVRYAVEHIEEYLKNNQEVIERYIAYKKSKEYKATPVYQWEKLLRQLHGANGYYDVFIPAMCRLSRSYKEYHEALLKADEVFAGKYPLYT